MDWKKLINRIIWVIGVGTILAWLGVLGLVQQIGVTLWANLTGHIQ